jgi:PAS domain S-box-containing protein
VVDTGPPVVRIVLLHTAVEGAKDGASTAPVSETLAALGRIGAEVEFDVYDDDEICLEACATGMVDLVVLERCSADIRSRVLEGVPDHGPPVVVVVESEGEEESLSAFRQGAADCIRIAADYAEVLPVVALEQIRRWRQVREREAARETIEWLERLHQAIFSEIPVSLVVLDARGRIVDVNPEFRRAFDVRERLPVGATLEQVLPEELIEGAGLRDEITAAGPRLARCQGRGKESRYFDVRSQRLDQEGQQLLVLTDVSESEILSRRVGELEHYTENIIQNINSALLVVDLYGHISFANPTAAQILGVREGSLVGRPADDWFGAPGDTESLVGRTLAEGKRFKGAETMITLDDGRAVPIGISCAPLLGADGAIRGVVAIFQDLSEIKQLQRQVLQTEKLASIGQLAAGVAHEINNPTGFIHANLFQMSEYLQDLQSYWDRVDDLQKAVADGDPQAAKEASEQLGRVCQEIDFDFIRNDFTKAVRESQEGSERIRHIVQDLKDFSHQDTGERLLADVNQCVDSTANIVWTMMKHSVVLEKDYDELPEVSCYPMQLKQVFMNLLVNAYQAIEEAITTPGETGVIRVVTRVQGGGVSISISDTGAGISKANLQRIFDPFFTTKEVGTGTGLGLSTSYGIIQRHGGLMRVESDEGSGTTFEVWLPMGAGSDDARTE